MDKQFLPGFENFSRVWQRVEERDMSGIARETRMAAACEPDYGSFCLLPGAIGGGRAVRFIPRMQQY